MKELFDYIDYRKFLADYYIVNKKKSRQFSYRSFLNRAGIKSPVFFKLVVDGKRNLSRSAMEKFIRALKLNEKEALYFRNLVTFDQAKTAIEKQECYQTLRSMKHSVSERTLKADQYDYFDKWYTCVIRELVCMFDFKNDFSLLAKTLKPEITAWDANKAVKLLLRLKLIKKSKGTLYKQTDTALTTGSEVMSLAVRKFNASMIEHGLSALERFPRNTRHISGLSFAVSAPVYNILTAEIEAFKDRIVNIVNRETDTTQVYQLNLQLFPLSDDIRDIRPGRNS
jgi:uncharacterized protein (TIGR02147 family)